MSPPSTTSLSLCTAGEDITLSTQILLRYQPLCSQRGRYTPLRLMGKVPCAARLVPALGAGLSSCIWDILTR